MVALYFICFKDLLLSPSREVFKAKHRQTGKKVALKKVLMENEKEGVRNVDLNCFKSVLNSPSLPAVTFSVKEASGDPNIRSPGHFLLDDGVFKPLRSFSGTTRGHPVCP